MRSFIVPAAIGIVVFMLMVTPVASQDGPLFTAYPSYSAKFDIKKQKFSLLTSVVVYNISGRTLTDVEFRQAYPEGVTLKETYRRDVGTEATGEQSSESKMDANIYNASISAYRSSQYVVLWNELEVDRRLKEITFPGVEINYSEPDGTRKSTMLASNTYDLFIYSNVVGGLRRFLSKYNKITFDFKKAIPQRGEWEFAPIVASARGSFPTGIIGTFLGEDQYDGHFRIRSGPPGDNVQILIVYKLTEKKDRITERDDLMKKLGKYLRWCGEFEFMENGLQVTQAKWKKHKDVWNLEGRWRDTIKDRLGEGSFIAKVFYAPREDVEYYVLGLVHGRVLGAEGSVTPRPEKEGQLVAELDALINTFRTSIKPLSSDKRRRH